MGRFWQALERHPANATHSASAAVSAVHAKAVATLAVLTASRSSGASAAMAQRVRYEQHVVGRMSDDIDRADSSSA
jgi:hypothetical protein